MIATNPNILPGALPPAAHDIEWLYRYRNDIWSFAVECCVTQDQVDKQNPVKKFPGRDSLKAPYLEFMMRQMQNEYLLAIVKNRRLLQTWEACIVTLHDAMFFEGRFCALISKKEEDSDELVRRCKFIYENIPRDKMPIKPKMTYKYCTMYFPETDSTIKGLAQGADQLRQYTISRIVADEIAFWQKAKETYVGMKPTLQGGGKILLLSTRYPGFFKQIIEDNIDDED